MNTPLNLKRYFTLCNTGTADDISDGKIFYACFVFCAFCLGLNIHVYIYLKFEA